MLSPANSFYIIDDHQLLIEGLKKSLSVHMPRWTCLGETAQFETALGFLKKKSPRFVLLDHSLNGKTGLDLIDALDGVIPAQDFILISQLNSKSILREYLERGVLALVSKNDEPLEIKTAMEHLIQSSEVHFSPVFKELIRAFDPLDILTRREIEVTRLITQGKTNKDVGKTLSCSEFTVKTHKANIMKKLDISNSVELSVWALKNHIV